MTKRLQMYKPNEIVDATGFITRSRTPIVQVWAGGSALQVNSDRIEAVLANYYSDPHKRELMRPWAVRWVPVLDNEHAFVALRDGSGMVSNSFLDKREWADLDRAIFEMVKLRRNAVADLTSRGLTKPSNLAEMLSQWRMGTERVRPSVNMDGRSRADRDRTERLVYSAPVPIYRTDYEIGRRELLASRKLGTPIDTFEAGEAAEAIAEEQERVLFEGDSTIVVQGNTLYGYTTLPARDTGTAAAYGGGDFGTITNIRPTFLGMLAALSAKRYHGPFIGYVADTQYHEMLQRYSDGSGQTALDTVKELPQIDDVKPSDFLDDGETVLVQMTPNVVDWIEAMGVDNREWESGDGMALFYAVMAAGAARLKTDAGGNAGIAHATSC